MEVQAIIDLIRPVWISRVASRLTQADILRADLVEQLNRFIERVAAVAAFGAPTTELDQIVAEWVKSRTESELRSAESDVIPVINQMMGALFAVCQEQLTPADALEVVDAVLPAYFHMLEFTAGRETEIHVRHITTELGQAKSTLERLEKSKSDFIAVAAHELKTPLTLIEGYATMLEELVPGLDSSASQSDTYLKGIHSGARRLREIVDDMIDVSMIDNNLLALTFQPVWINRLLNAIQRDVSEVIATRKLAFSARDFPGSQEMTYADGERLYQAMKNLILNAIKYTPDGGKIVVDGRQLPGFIEVTIADTGIGIAPEDHQRIFEKFGRVGSASLHSSGKTKFKGGGPGLGLPIAKGIIEAHGGAIWVESDGYDETLCPGSIFHVLLPVRKAPPIHKSERLFRSGIERQASGS